MNYNIIVSDFTQNIFNESELKDLNHIMEIEDDVLQQWFFNKRKNKLIPDNKITQMLKKFKI